MEILVCNCTALLNIRILTQYIFFELAKQHKIRIDDITFGVNTQEHEAEVVKIILEKSTIIIKNQKLKINIPKKVADEVIDYILKETLELKD